MRRFAVGIVGAAQPATATKHANGGLSEEAEAITEPRKARPGVE